jgi:hypothetical protein
MMWVNKILMRCMVLGAVLNMPLYAQDFGFGDESSGGGGDGASANAAVSTGAVSGAVSISGEAAATLLGYGDDFSEGADAVRLGDVFSGKLNFKAGVSNAEGVINLKLAPASVSDTALTAAPAASPISDTTLTTTPAASPIAIDEAYLRAYLGAFDIEGGLRKLTWGKADSMGPLDVINPLDYADLTVLADSLSDSMARKIARPLIRVSWNAGSFSKLEGVFVPSFEGARFAAAGRWTPRQLADIPAALPVIQADTSALDYAQAGLRFTTTIGSSDIGAQYYYGRLPLPAFSFSFTPTPAGPVPTALTIDHNRYHQIGIDCARVIAGFNVRAEAAANLTDDLNGDDGAVYNPHLAWSLGFDRDVVWGINLNLQAAETIILLHDKIGGNPLLDIEALSDVTSTRITAKLSKAFFRDELEIAASAIWGIEDKDILIMPSITWTKGDVALELAGGIFAGDEGGQFGQYRDNSFVRARVKYTF